MIETELGQVAALTGGVVHGDSALRIRGAEFDSRRIQPGVLFCALAGAVTHGHSFVKQVKSVGAAAALVEDPSVLIDADLPGVVVKDSLIAMQQLAAWWRMQVGLPVLAVTGSVGKTTTKEIAAAILATAGRGTYSQASFNNHVGVPYTLLQIDRNDKWAVIEIGMNHRGEIAPLSKLAAPNVALVTTVAPAHIGNLGSLEAIAAEKLDIAAGLSPQGKLFINADVPELLAGVAALNGENSLARGEAADSWSVGYFGSITSPVAAQQVVTIASSAPSSDGISLNLILNNLTVARETSRRDAINVSKSTVANDSGNGWGEFKCVAPLFGTHHATNVAAALTGALNLIPGLQPARVAAAISAFQVPEKRFVRLRAKVSGGEIFDDSYNANPTSMRAFFEATKPFWSGKKNWGIVLGEMRELGEFGQRYHREIAEYVAALNPGFVIAVGEDGAKEYERVFANFPQISSARVADSVAAIAALGERPFEVLLVKGARGVRLERFVQGIT